MSDDWGNDPVQPVQPAAGPASTPQAGDWGNDPVVGTSKFKFSDKAINSAIAKPGGMTVYMKPSEYLALTPDLPDNPRTDRKGASLQKSLANGDDVDQVPSLDVTVGKDGSGKVTDQDGRHRALFAQQAGIDAIPVRIQHSGAPVPISHLKGMNEGMDAIPFNFAEAVPKGPVMPTKKVGFGGEVLQGAADPFIGLGRLEAKGAEALAKGAAALGVPGAKGVASDLQAYNDPRDAALQRREKEYEAGRQAEAGAKALGFDWGRLAGNIISPANLAALPAGEAGTAAVLAKRAEPVLAAAVRGVARQAATTGTGGAVIAAMNPVTGGDYWTDKAKQTAVGFGAGTAIPPIFAVGSKGLVKAGAATVAPLVRYVAGIKGPNATLTAAEQEVLRRLGDGQAGGGPTAQDILDLAHGAPDKPLTLMDVQSSPVNALAGRIYRSGGPAKQRIGNFLVDRTKEQQDRLTGDVGKGLSPDSAYSTVQAMMQSRGNAAVPLYTEAYEKNQSIASPMIDKILTTPAGKQALGAARVKMQNDMTKMGVPDKEIAEQMREAGDAVPRGGVASGLKLRTLDYVKRSLDDMIGGAQRAGERDNARILTDMKRSLVSEIDKSDATATRDAAGKIVKPGLYSQARAAYSGPSQSMDAVEFGQNAMKPGTVLEENVAHFNNLNPNDQEFARIGMAQTMRDMIRKKDVGTNAARTLAKNPDVQARVRPFFRSDGDYQKFIKSVTAEDNMFHTVRRTMGGSDTAERLGEDDSSDAAAMAHAAHAGIKFSSGNWLGGATSLWRSIGEYAKRPNPELGDEISKLLTAPLNQQASPGMKLLRDFSAVAPGTKNYLAQATNRAARASTIPTAIVTGEHPQK